MMKIGVVIYGEGLFALILTLAGSLLADLSKGERCL